LGNTNWRTEPTNLEKLADDLWLGIKLPINTYANEGQDISVPAQYSSTTATTGTTVPISVKAKRDFNAIRMQVRVTTSGSSSSGTSRVNTLIGQIKMWRGSSNQGTPLLVVNPVGKESAAVYLAVLSALRAKSRTSAGLTNLVNQVCAGNSTYYFACDIPINGKAGPLYFEITVAPAADLAGYSTKPTGMTTEIALMPIGCRPVMKDEMIEVGKKTTSSGFTSTGPVSEVMLASATEMGSVLALEFDGSKSGTAMVLLEDVTHARLQGSFSGTAVAGDGGKYVNPPIDPNTTATALYVVYATVQTPELVNVQISTPTTVMYALVS